jgi:DNA processing protein
MSDVKYWMALDQVQGMGPANLKLVREKLEASGLSMRDLFDLDAGDIQKEFSLGEKIAAAVIAARKSLSLVEREYLALSDAGCGAILFYEDSYPARLRELMGNTAPPILYYCGNKKILAQRGAAVLGDMHVSEKGRLVAYMAAKILASHGIAVIGGMAQGAGMTAHRSALENGGTTVAVLPHGTGHLKIPEAFREVFDETRAVIISPFYPNREYSVFNSFNRNRVAAALARAVLIVEAPAEGGIFEAGKSAKSLNVPLYVTEYAKYPDNAAGNPKLMSEFGGIPVRGRPENELLVPNLDRLIGDVKFGE